MKNILLFIFLLLQTLYGNGQDATVKELKAEAGRTIKKDPADTLPLTWRVGGLYNINIAQGSLSNWAAGGDDFSLALTSVLNAFAFYRKGRHSWDNTFDFNLGYVKTTSLGNRKNDDRIDLLSKYGYAVSSKWNLAGLFNFRSQLFKGYTYDENVRHLSSAFLSPAYITLSAGFDYKPNAAFSVFASPVTARWVLVRNKALSAKGAYGVDTGSHSKIEIGAFVTANYFKALSKTITYRGRLDLFSNYRHNPQNIDLFMTNVFAAKISSVLAVTWNLDLIYDDDVKIFGDDGNAAATQIKSLLGVGLSVKF